VIWSCDSSKSPDTGGYNFGLINFCLEEIKRNIISVVQEFTISGIWPRD